jgi:hypothetical protein
MQLYCIDNRIATGLAASIVMFQDISYGVADKEQPSLPESVTAALHQPSGLACLTCDTWLFLWSLSLGMLYTFDITK